jgi:hypothetical protein
MPIFARRLPVPLLVACVFSLLALLGLSLRLATLPPLRFFPDDPALAAAGFYPVERGTEGIQFRWSGPSAGFLLPALAARQVTTLTLATARPAGQPAPTGIRLTANGSDVPVPPGGAWTDLAVSAPSQVGLANAVALTATGPDDSFYPGPNDHRHLMVAVRAVSMAPLPVGGVPLPAPLPGLAALLLPLLTYGLLRPRSTGWIGAAGAA